MIEPRQARRSRQRDAKLLPVSGVREPKLLERCPHDIFDDDEMRLRRDHETLGGDGSVGNLPRVLVHQRHSRYELPDETQRSIDVERDPFPLGQCENLGEPYTRRAFGHERQRRTGVAQAVHAADTSVTGVAKAREPADALAQCEFK